MEYFKININEDINDNIINVIYILLKKENQKIVKYENNIYINKENLTGDQKLFNQFRQFLNTSYKKKLIKLKEEDFIKEKGRKNIEDYILTKKTKVLIDKTQIKNYLDILIQTDLEKDEINTEVLKQKIRNNFNIEKEEKEVNNYINQLLITYTEKIKKKLKNKQMELLFQKIIDNKPKKINDDNRKYIQTYINRKITEYNKKINNVKITLEEINFLKQIIELKNLYNLKIINFSKKITKELSTETKKTNVTEKISLYQNFQKDCQKDFILKILNKTQNKLLRIIINERTEKLKSKEKLTKEEEEELLINLKYQILKKSFNIEERTKIFDKYPELMDFILNNNRIINKEKMKTNLLDTRKQIKNLQENINKKWIISIDLEFFQENQKTKIFEIGYTMVDAGSGKRLISKNFIIEENQKYSYKPSSMSCTKKLTLKKAIEEMNEDFQRIKNKGEGAIVVGNGIDFDLQTLLKNGLKIKVDQLVDLSNILKYLDKTDISISLEKMIRIFNLEHHGIIEHNAGNDSYLSVKVMLKMLNVLKENNISKYIKRSLIEKLTKVTSERLQEEIVSGINQTRKIKELKERINNNVIQNEEIQENIENPHKKYYKEEIYDFEDLINNINCKNQSQKIVIIEKIIKKIAQKEFIMINKTKIYIKEDIILKIIKEDENLFNIDKIFEKVHMINKKNNLFMVINNDIFENKIIQNILVNAIPKQVKNRKEKKVKNQ